MVQYGDKTITSCKNQGCSGSLTYLTRCSQNSLISITIDDSTFSITRFESIVDMMPKGYWVLGKNIYSEPVNVSHVVVINNSTSVI